MHIKLPITRFERYINHFAVGGGTNYCDQRVCLSVSVRWHISRTTSLNFTKISVHVNCSILLSSVYNAIYCYTLGISGIVNDVMVSLARTRRILGVSHQAAALIRYGRRRNLISTIAHKYQERSSKRKYRH